MVLQSNLTSPYVRRPPKYLDCVRKGGRRYPLSPPAPRARSLARTRLIYDLLEARNRLARRFVQLQCDEVDADPKIINFIGSLDDRVEPVDINDTPTLLTLIDALDRELRHSVDAFRVAQQG